MVTCTPTAAALNEVRTQRCLRFSMTSLLIKDELPGSWTNFHCTAGWRGSGAIAAILTVLPEQSVRLWDAVQRGDHDEARAMHARLLPVWRAINHPDMSSRTKLALQMQGRAAGIARHPILPVSDQGRAEIASALERAGINTMAVA